MAERRTVPKKDKPRPQPTVRKVMIEVIDPPPPSELRGLLPTPPEIEEIVEQMYRERPASPEARLRTTEGLKMQYYFGGYNYAFRDTPQGREVLAVGSEEIQKLFKKLPASQRKGIVLTSADLW